MIYVIIVIVLFKIIFFWREGGGGGWGGGWGGVGVGGWVGWDYVFFLIISVFFLKFFLYVRFILGKDWCSFK